MLQRKAKNPRGPVPIRPGGKFLPDPRAGDRLFPEHVSKTCLPVPQAGHASREMPKPYPPSTWSPCRGFREWPNAPGLIHLGGTTPSRAWQDTSGCSKALAPLAIALHPISYSCCPWLHRGRGWRALQCSSRRRCLGLATAVQLKRPESLGHLHGLVVLIW